MTYPLALRKRALETKEKLHLTDQQTAELFGIGTATLSRWKKCLKPQERRHKPATKIQPEVLLQDVEKYPDDYLRERAKRLNVSVSGIFVALKRLGIGFKKGRFPTSKQVMKNGKRL